MFKQETISKNQASNESQNLNMLRKHLSELLERAAVAEWNKWREENPKVPVELSHLDLSNRDFEGINLFEVDLRGVNFQQANLENANLIAANLQEANLSQANLSNANLIAANLSGANLSKAQIQNAKLLTTKLNNANLNYVDLSEHDLRGQVLRGAQLRGANLSHQNLRGQDLTGADLMEANLSKANLKEAILTRANLAHAQLKGTDLTDAIMKQVNFTAVDLKEQNFSGVNFKGSNLSGADLRDTNLNSAILDDCILTGAKLWKVETRGWSIKNIDCEFAIWDRAGAETTRYNRHEFERLYAETIRIELYYDHRLTTNEIVTLPFLIEHLQAHHWGCVLRLKSIEDVPGGAKISICVEETGGYNPAFLEAELREEASQFQLAQLASKEDRFLQSKLKEAIAKIKNDFWPKLLELALDHENQQVRNLTVLFMDLKGFSLWEDNEVNRKLSLFRGLVKPVLSLWQARHLNMEGDSLRATFDNASSGIACACMIQKVLSAADFSVRIGMDLGQVTVVHNEVTELPDLEGNAVNFAARLESHGKASQVLVSETIRHYADQNKREFEFVPVEIVLDKSVGKMMAGDRVECYFVNML